MGLHWCLYRNLRRYVRASVLTVGLDGRLTNFRPTPPSSLLSQSPPGAAAPPAPHQPAPPRGLTLRGTAITAAAPATFSSMNDWLAASQDTQRPAVIGGCEITAIDVDQCAQGSGGPFVTTPRDRSGCYGEHRRRSSLRRPPIGDAPTRALSLRRKRPGGSG